jgi:hypothetical protein
VLWSDHPNEWVTLQPPPSEEDFAESLPDPELRRRPFDLAAAEWSEKILPFSRLQSDAGMFQASAQFLTVSMRPMGVLWYSQAREAQSQLGDTLESGAREMRKERCSKIGTFATLSARTEPFNRNECLQRSIETAVHPSALGLR